MDFLLVAAVSFLITVSFTPLTIWLAKKYGLVDDPVSDPHPKKIHKDIIPRAGGFAIFAGILLTTWFFLPLEKHLYGILFGITVLLLIGLVDDRKKNFSPYTRLILLFLAAGTAVGSGIGISFITNPLSGVLNLPHFIQLDTLVVPFNLLGPHRIVILADIFAFLWIVSLTQVINWSKGVDGQMPVITSVAALVLGFLSLRLFNQGDPSQLTVAKLCFITTGASLGFLIFNWHPAKIFPGFSGSTILAFMLATLAILSGAKVATALLVLAVPSVDFVYTIIRRVARGKSPVWGDRGHLHHRLLDLGWSAAQISLFYLFLSAILGLIALSVDTRSKAFGLAVVGVAFICFILWLNSFGGLSKNAGRGNG